MMWLLADSKPSSSLYFDEGLWAEILKSLPVVVLLRFKCVCKSWNSLISSPAFIRAHSLSYKSAESKTFILFDTPVEWNPTLYALYKPDQFSRPSESQQSQHHVSFQIIPFCYDFEVISDVIHGVVCLSANVYSDDDNIPVSGYTILWNPAIRKYVNIPRRDSTIDVGFGFDACKNDFKVVRTNEDWPPNTLEVYSYREGRSTTVDSGHIGPFYIVSLFDNSCFINGAIHWIIRQQDGWWLAILVFDCETEELKTMELSQRFNQPGLEVKIEKLFVHFGKVSVMVVTKTEGDDKGETAVWVMDDYGVGTSWKKTTYHEDLAKITQDGVRNIWTNTNQEGPIKASQPLWNGYVFEPSMLLMDAESWMDAKRVTTRSRWPGSLTLLVSLAILTFGFFLILVCMNSRDALFDLYERILGYGGNMD